MVLSLRAKLSIYQLVNIPTLTNDHELCFCITFCVYNKAFSLTVEYGHSANKVNKTVNEHI